MFVESVDVDLQIWALTIPNPYMGDKIVAQQNLPTITIVSQKRKYVVFLKRGNMW